MTDLVHVLMEMRAGAVASELSKEFSELVDSIVETGQGGSMTITIKVAPSKASMSEGVIEVELSHVSNLKKPKVEIGKSFFFVAKDHALTRHDPNQLSLEAQINAGR